MQELIAKIEQWAEDRNIIKGSKPIDQAMKLFSEFGELADNVGKGRDCRDDIGDVFVVLTIICKQCGLSISDYLNQTLEHSGVKVDVAFLGNELSVIATELYEWDESSNIEYFPYHSLQFAISRLFSIAAQNNTTLQECVQIAYDDIKDRKGIMHSGLFIKESDPAYQDILLELNKC